MIPLEARELKLQDLKQAIAIESERRYIDVQGKKQRFSAFLLKTLEGLTPYLAQDKEHQAVMAMVKQYPVMDVPGRMKILNKVAEGLHRLEHGFESPKAASKVNPTTRSPLETDVQFVKGVGPRVAEVLNRAEIFTVWDLLNHYPRRYLDYNQRLKISALTVGQDATVIGRIHSVNAHNARNRKIAIVSVTVKDETGTLVGNWIFQAANRNTLEMYKKRYTVGAEVMLSGRVKYDEYKRKLAMDRPEVEVLSYDGEEADRNIQGLHTGRIVPVYPLVEGLNLRVLRRAMRHALDDYLEGVTDPLPEEIRKKYQLLDLQKALEQIHFPDSFESYHDARNRLVFDELFSMQFRLAYVRAEYKRHARGLSFAIQPDNLTERFMSQLPFRLTTAQQRVFDEIRTDMQSPQPMYRLLQGDVGSGKTIMALLTLLIAIEHGYQGALMAPTEILAEQHYRNCVQWLTPLGLKVGLIVGRSGVKERRELLQGLLNGQIHLAVGTHALIQEGVEFRKLGAVVVDEQHRFGVRQRLLLKDKGENPEMLTMTATPIPRTLAMTLHGDLDVSILDELPPGRTPIITKLFRGKLQREQAYGLISQEIVRGRQAYIVVPLVEESENFSAKAATAEFERLSQEVFPHLRLGLLHGKLPPQEKDAVMKAFASRQLDILVSTTVIEVGVDVPNATVMLIEDADRFGLAQLHQLRGRVGRGSHQSYCLLLAESKSGDTLQRLRLMEETNDGFVIAEKDLELRGPGEFLGTRQSGLPDFSLADLVQDRVLLEQAREAATYMLSTYDVTLQFPELCDMVHAKTERAFSVLSSG